MRPKSCMEADEQTHRCTVFGSALLSLLMLWSSSCAASPLGASGLGERSSISSDSEPSITRSTRTTTKENASYRPASRVRTLRSISQYQSQISDLFSGCKLAPDYAATTHGCLLCDRPDGKDCVEHVFGECPTLAPLREWTHTALSRLAGWVPPTGGE